MRKIVSVRANFYLNKQKFGTPGIPPPQRTSCRLCKITKVTRSYAHEFMRSVDQGPYAEISQVARSRKSLYLLIVALEVA